MSLPLTLPRLAPRLLTLLFALLCLAADRPAWCDTAVASGQVKAGGFCIFPATGTADEDFGMAANEWGIYLNGTEIAYSHVGDSQTNGWSVSISDTKARPTSYHEFTIIAPASATLGPGYAIRYTSAAPEPLSNENQDYFSESAIFAVMPQRPAPAPGPAHAWQGSVDGVNTGTGNKTTSIPLIGWTARGGMPVSFALTHNSQSSDTNACGPKWSLSYDAYVKNRAIHWGNGEVDDYTSAAILPGIDGTLVVSGNNYTFTTTAKTVYTFVYNPARALAVLTGIKDITGNVITINRNTSNGTISTIVDPTNRALSFVYNNSGQLTSVTFGTMSGSTFTAFQDPYSLPHVWKMFYDGNGELQYVRWPQVSPSDTAYYYLQFGYDANGHNDITDFWDKNYNHTTYSYNAYDSPLWEMDAYNHQTTFAYNGNVTTVTDPNNHTTTHTYGLQLVSNTDALGKTENMTYNWDNQLFTKTSRRDGSSGDYDSSWTYGYASATAVDQSGTTYLYSTATISTCTFYDGANQYTHDAYTPNGKVWTKAEFFGMAGSIPTHFLTTTYLYAGNTNPNSSTDGDDTLTTVQSPLTYVNNSGTWTQTYATTQMGGYANGLPASATDATKHVTAFQYDGNGYINKVTDTNNATTQATYNALGWKLSSTDGMNQTTTYTYDNWGRVIAVTDPLNNVTHTAYDANGNVLTVKDPMWTSSAPAQHIVTNNYDALNRLLTTTDGSGDGTRYTYDGTDANKNTQYGLLSTKTVGIGTGTPNTPNGIYSIAYVYTARNEVAQTLYPDGTSEADTYDADGNVQTHTKRDQSVIQYTNDGDNRVTLITYPNDPPVTFVYDTLGRRTTMNDKQGGNATTTTWTYDDGDRLTQLTQPQGTVSYTYLDNDWLATRTLAGTGTWTYTYGLGYNTDGSLNAPSNSGSRLLALQTPFTNDLTKFYTFDGDNRVTEQINGDNTITYFGYDAAGRANGVEHEASSGSPLSDYAYYYNADGTIYERDDYNASNAKTATTFAYDGGGQLTSEQRAGTGGYTLGYTYDHNSNRLTSTQNGTATTYTYAYQVPGTKNSSGAAMDELIQYQTGSTVLSYQYDKNGSQVYNHNNITGETTTQTWSDAGDMTGWNSSVGMSDQYYYNGLGLRVDKETNNNGVKTSTSTVCDGATPGSAVLYDGAATYTEGLSEHRGSVSSYLHGDILGSLRLMTQGQSITDTLLYDAFGESVSETNPAPTPYKFVGGKGYQSDGDTNLQLLGYRYYNPMIGRFLSSDPIQSGDNWYAYCGNDPLGKADPSGEAFQPGGGSDLGSIGGQYDFISPFDSFHVTIMAAPTPPGWNDQWTLDDKGNNVSPDGNETWHYHGKDATHSEDHWDIDIKHDDHTESKQFYPDRNSGAGEYEQRYISKSRDANRKAQAAQREQNKREKAANDAKSRQGQQFNRFYVTPAPNVGPSLVIRPFEPEVTPEFTPEVTPEFVPELIPIL